MKSFKERSGSDASIAGTLYSSTAKKLHNKLFEQVSITSPKCSHVAKSKLKIVNTNYKIAKNNKSGKLVKHKCKSK